VEQLRSGAPSFEFYPIAGEDDPDVWLVSVVRLREGSPRSI
jgi:hypothetical protein